MIRKPIDLHRIHQKILTGNYDSLESMLLDVTMMFDNAMLFNEPDSVLYKVSTRHPVFHFTPKMVDCDLFACELHFKSLISKNYKTV